MNDKLIGVPDQSPPVAALPPFAVAMQPVFEPIMVDYTNYKGERSIRRIFPTNMFYGTTEYHPQPQYLLTVHDFDKKDQRIYALSGFHRFGTPNLLRLGEGFDGGFTRDHELKISAVDLMEAAARISGGPKHLVGTTNWAACMYAHLQEASARKGN